MVLPWLGAYTVQLCSFNLVLGINDIARSLVPLLTCTVWFCMLSPLGCVAVTGHQFAVCLLCGRHFIVMGGILTTDHYSIVYCFPSVLVPWCLVGSQDFVVGYGLFFGTPLPLSCCLTLPYHLLVLLLPPAPQRLSSSRHKWQTVPY